MRISISRKLRTASAPLAIILGLVLHPLLAHAEKKNGGTPEEERACEAADLHGAAWGLCNAYCEAMDCDSDDPQASDNACERVLKNWEEHEDGMTIPCEEVECPCWSSSEELEFVHDSNSPPSYGRPTFRICFENENGLVLGVSDSVVRTRIESFVDAKDATCVTEVLPFREPALPVLRVDDLTAFEIQACRHVIEELCP